MNVTVKDILCSYLRNDEIEIQFISFLKGGNISKDILSIQYYSKINGQWNLCTDSISPDGEIVTRKTPAAR